MAADSFAPLGGQSVHLVPGSTELVIGSTSRLTLEGQLYHSSNHVLTASTAASTLTNYGISIVAGKSTDGGSLIHTLAAPRPGVRKTIICTSANTTETVRIDANNSLFAGYGTQDILVFSAPGTAATLVGLSTASWGIESLSPLTTGTIGVATTS